MHAFCAIPSRIAKYIIFFREISSSSCRGASTDIPDPLSPLLPIVHRFWQVLRATYLHRAGRSAFAWPYKGVHRSTSLMSSSLLLQQCLACLVRLTWIVFVMEGRWPYSWCFVGCCLQDLFNIARSILVQLPSSFFSSRLVSASIQQYRHDCYLEETAFHFIGQV